MLNAAAALVVSEITADLKEAAQMAITAIDSGAAARTLARWVEVSNLEEPGEPPCAAATLTRTETPSGARRMRGVLR